MNNSQKNKPNKILKRIVNITFYLSILFFISAFNFQDNKIGGWYQQFMPNLNGRTISDMTFTDSLTGYAVTPYVSMNDSTFILKTTNGGDNWFFALRQPGSAGGFRQIQFINVNTGFVCGNFLKKTTNAGINWNSVNTSGIFPENMFVISNDTIWLSDTEPLTGGMFRTTNGGLSWQRLTNGINQPYPDKLYFYNSRIGFATNYQYGSLYKTTNSGINWFGVAGSNGFNDIVFVDSLTGFKTSDSTRKSTDGGISWKAQIRPRLNVWNSFYQFALINKETIWGVGGVIYTSLVYRDIVYKTTNGGINWGYQIPDLINITIGNFNKICFINKNIGWAYLNGRGVHTLTGGNDTTIYTSINNITQISPKNFELKQNYPNPYNNSSLIEYYINETGWVKLKIFDIAGREMGTLVNEEQNTGGYGIPIAIQLSSGVYFYKMIYINRKGEMQMDVKKLVVLK